MDRIDPLTGKRKQIMKTFKRKKDAAAFEAEWETDKAHGSLVDPSRMLVGEYLRYWLETCATPPKVRPNTYASYESLIRVQITPAIGSIPLQRLTALQVQGLYAAIQNGPRADQKSGPLSTRTVRYCHTILKMARKQAVRWRLVPHNVAEDVDPPKATRPQIEFWTKREALTFINATQGDSYGAIWDVALNTGMRKGELLALRWGAVDLRRGAIRVRENAGGTRGAGSPGDPKSKAGFRTITLPPDTLSALREHHARQQLQPLALDGANRAGGLVFTSSARTAIDQRNLSARFERLVRRAKVKEISFHGMRHTHATLLLLEGVDIKTVSTRLGHASIQITADTYLHFLPELDQRAADAIGRALGGSRKVM